MGKVTVGNRRLKLDDRLVALLGITISLALIATMLYQGGRLIFVFPGALTLVACLAWLRLRTARPASGPVTSSRAGFLLLATVFFVLLAAALLILNSRAEAYERPALLFVIMSLMGGVIALEIIFTSSRGVPLVLTQLVLLAVLFSWSQNILFPNVVGLDNWAHQYFTTNLISAGHVPSGFGYSELPFFHLLVGGSEILMGVGYKAALMSIVVVAQVIVEIGMVYSLSNHVFKNERMALFSALAATVAVWSIRTSVTPLPTSLGFTFVLVGVYLLVKGHGFRTTSLVVLMAFSIVLTHTIAAVCMIVLIGAGLIASKIRWNEMTPSKKIVPISYLAFFSVLTFSWWSYASDQVLMLREILQVGFSRDIFLDMGAKVVHHVPPTEEIFNMAGQFAFYAIAFIGVLYSISRRGSPKAAWIGSIGVALLGVGFVSTVAQLGLLQDRWWYYAQLFLAVPVGAALFLIYRTAPGQRLWGPRAGKVISAILVVSMVISLGFVSMLSPSANLDNPIYSPNTGIRLGFTQSELSGASFYSSQTNATIASDFDFGPNPSSSVFLNFYRIHGWRIVSLDDALKNNVWQSNGTVQFVRSWVYDHPFRVGGWDYSVDYDLGSSLLWSDLSRTYTNGGASGYW